VLGLARWTGTLGKFVISGRCIVIPNDGKAVVVRKISLFDVVNVTDSFLATVGVDVGVFVVVARMMAESIVGSRGLPCLSVFF